MTSRPIESKPSPDRNTIFGFVVDVVVIRRAGQVYVDRADRLAEDLRVGELVKARLQAAIPDGFELITPGALYEIHRCAAHGGEDDDIELLDIWPEDAPPIHLDPDYAAPA